MFFWFGECEWGSGLVGLALGQLDALRVSGLAGCA